MIECFGDDPNVKVIAVYRRECKMGLDLSRWRESIAQEADRDAKSWQNDAVSRTPGRWRVLTVPIRRH